MASRLPAVLAHPSVARAAVGPPAIALTAAGVGIGVLDHSLPLAVVLAIVGWGGRMGWAVRARVRARRVVRPQPVDPWSVPSPWREQLRAAVDAQDRFDQAARSLADGPTRERVDTLRQRIDDAVRLAATTARRGALLAGPQRATTAEALSAELAGLAGRAGTKDPGVLSHEAAVAAQLRALRRAQAVSVEALDQVRLLAARIDDAVTALVELAMDASAMDASAMADGTPRGNALGDVAEEIEALRSGIEASGMALDAAGTAAALPSGTAAGGSAMPDAPATS